MITEWVESAAMARGSVVRRSGGWAYKVDTGFHSETGKRRQSVKQGFRTKRQAESALAGVQNTVIDGTVVATSGIRLDAYLDQWLAGQEARLRPSSHHSYVMAGKRLKRHFGRCKLQALTPLQIEKFYADLLNRGGRNGAGLASSRGQMAAIAMPGWPAARRVRSSGSWVRTTPPPKRIAVATTSASMASSLPAPAAARRCPATRAVRAPVVTTCAKPRATTESIALSVPPPRYSSTSTADGTRTGKFLW